MKIFSVYDSKAEVFWKPIFDINAGIALRGFADAAKGANDQAGAPNAIAQHPEDYTLFEIGDWDMDTGKIITWEAKISLGTAIEFIEQEPARMPDNVSKIQGGQ